MSLPLNSIPIPVSSYETTLAADLTASGTSLTLVGATDDAGNAISGVIGLTCEGEFIVGTKSGTSVTGLLRGIDPQDGTTERVALKAKHVRGTPIVITDAPFLSVAYRLLNGNESFPNKLGYASHPTFSANTELIDKKYADDLAIAGSPDASTTVKGISEEATTAEIDAGNAAGGTGAQLFVNPSALSTSIYSTQLPSSAQKSALAGTSGTPGSGNKYVTNDDTSATAAASKVVRSGAGSKIAEGYLQMTDAQATALTGGGDTALHKHDRIYIFEDGSSTGTTLTVTPGFRPRAIFAYSTSTDSHGQAGISADGNIIYQRGISGGAIAGLIKDSATVSTITVSNVDATSFRLNKAGSNRYDISLIVIGV